MNASLHPAVIVELREEEKKAYVTIRKASSYPTYGDVRNALQANGIPYWIDEITIQRALDRGIIDKPLTAAFAKDGKLEIKMEEHERAAYLTLKSAYGGYEVTLDQALTKIQEAGIVFGINYGTVRSIFSDKVYGCTRPFRKGQRTYTRY